jgi:hypothetical protein
MKNAKKKRKKLGKMRKNAQLQNAFYSLKILIPL